MFPSASENRRNGYESHHSSSTFAVYLHFYVLVCEQGFRRFAYMTRSTLQNGSQLAAPVRGSSKVQHLDVQPPQTIEELLACLENESTPNIPMLRTTSSLLAIYHCKPPDQLTIDSINEARSGFRAFLLDRKYAGNSIRSYINFVRTLLRHAEERGWKADESLPEAWCNVFTLASEKKCADLARYLARIRKSPMDVKIEDVDDWVERQVKQGHFWGNAQTKRLRFWRLLRDKGWTKQKPICLIRGTRFGVPLQSLPGDLRKEVTSLLRWKEAAFVVDRPKGGKIRKVTSKRLELIICALFGFSRLSGGQEFTSMVQLVQKQTVSAFVAWCMKEREVKGQSLQLTLGTLHAALRQHPAYSSLDLGWFRPLIDNIPVVEASAPKKRKAAKYLEYSVLESIYSLIRSERMKASKRGVKHVSRLALKELLFKWLLVLPWRQRNLRECRISGPNPNLFKGKIAPFSDIDQPLWVRQELEKNPDAEFWQFQFVSDETKTKKDVHALLPRQLIDILEEYLD